MLIEDNSEIVFYECLYCVRSSVRLAMRVCACVHAYARACLCFYTQALTKSVRTSCLLFVTAATRSKKGELIDFPLCRTH